MKALSTAIAASALILSVAPLLVTPAFAGEREDQVNLCASAIDAQGLANTGDYRAKFVKAKGGAAQTVTIKLIPTREGDSLTAECLIKKGEVAEATIQS
ncbi:MAG TPA: hypothetical protein DEA40_11270 [Parvularcula sp.]|nr:hypothetical protein [Parvularcula sp.]HBS36782.1 hypothetical protein [Parvularcula sp.]